MAGNNPLIIYIDVDDTLIRSAGSKRIPVSGMVEHVRALKEQGAILYCWSSAGGAYAEEVATEFGIRECFVAFLPKPQVIIDDQEVERWRRTIQVHPGRCAAMSCDRYRKAVTGEVPLG
jgi:phosphoserine phosphatase